MMSNEYISNQNQMCLALELCGRWLYHLLKRLYAPVKGTTELVLSVTPRQWAQKA
jgi:hypothetical protein